MPGRFAVFLAIVLSIWTLMNAYVLGRMWGLPPFQGAWPRRLLLLGGITLAVSFPLGRILAHRFPAAASVFELAGSAWIGVLFLALVALLAADLATGFGYLLPRLSVPARMTALATAAVLACLALVLALSPPVIRREEVRIRDLPAERDGLKVVAISDLHLGELLGQRWLAARVAQVRALAPDMVFVVGDVVDDVPRVEPMLPLLRELSAPLGVYAVSGNHEHYAGLEESLGLFRAAGFRVLRDESAEVAPGIVVAGIDDLTARDQFGATDDPLERALAARPRGATLFLSHTPWQAERAARLGAGLMVSGHTHDGQIWPFRYLVRLRYPYIAGRYQVGDMTLVVGRGTGFWGPPMRLFRRAEILALTLRRG
ncbi:MAG: metallophosphoesterase [Acidobacteria bacterium]|nr:metallophosphoesterase [Acidobacteriota bacterium]